MIRKIITIDEEKCIGCGMCSRAGPADAISKTDYIAPTNKFPSWQIDDDNFDSFFDDLSEGYNELCMEHVPMVIESLYKSDEKIKTMIFRMLLEFTCEDIPYVTNLENLQMFDAKLEYIYSTLAKVFSWCFNGFGNCKGNYRRYFSW